MKQGFPKKCKKNNSLRVVVISAKSHIKYNTCIIIIKIYQICQIYYLYNYVFTENILFA